MNDKRLLLSIALFLAAAGAVAALSFDKAGAEKDVDRVVGGQVLRRFKLIIDYSHRRVILEPNGSLDDPFDVES